MRRQCDRVRDGDLVAYLANPDDEALRDVHTHVIECEECAGELRAWQGLRGDLLLDDPIVSHEHPAEENLIAYCDNPGSLGAALRTEIEAHLSGCAACRDETKVFAGVRLERAEAVERSRGGESSADAQADALFDSIPHPAVIESVSFGQRLRHPGFAFALFLVLTVPVVGLLAIDRGGLPESATSELGSLGEIELDSMTLTGHRVGRDIITQNSLSRKPASKTNGSATRGTVKEFDRSEKAAVAVPSAPASTEDSVERVLEIAKSLASAPVAAPADEERLASHSVAENVLSPEQLMAMLETERRVNEMRRRSLEIPDAEPEDHVRRGAAVLETMPAGDADDASLEKAESARGSGNARMSAMVPAESMIMGVRDLGTAPVRGAMIGIPDSQAESSQGESLPTRRRASFDKARIHFVRGSSYVFTPEEVTHGMEVRFPLPVREGQAVTVEARLVEVGTDREIVETFAPPGGALQASPLVSLNVPSGWLSAGRYSVILTHPNDDSGWTSSINIRVLAASE